MANTRWVDEALYILKETIKPVSEKIINRITKETQDREKNGRNRDDIPPITLFQNWDEDYIKKHLADYDDIVKQIILCLDNVVNHEVFILLSREKQKKLLDEIVKNIGDKALDKINIYGGRVEENKWIVTPRKLGGILLPLSDYPFLFCYEARNNIREASYYNYCYTTIQGSGPLGKNNYCNNYAITVLEERIKIALLHTLQALQGDIIEKQNAITNNKVNPWVNETNFIIQQITNFLLEKLPIEINNQTRISFLKNHDTEYLKSKIKFFDSIHERIRDALAYTFEYESFEVLSHDVQTEILKAIINLIINIDEQLILSLSGTNSHGEKMKLLYMKLYRINNLGTFDWLPHWFDDYPNHIINIHIIDAICEINLAKAIRPIFLNLLPYSIIKKNSETNSSVETTKVNLPTPIPDNTKPKLIDASVQTDLLGEDIQEQLSRVKAEPQKSEQTLRNLSLFQPSSACLQQASVIPRRPAEKIQQNENFGENYHAK